MHDLAETVAKLAQRVEALEHRLSVLERPSHSGARLPDPTTAIGLLPASDAAGLPRAAGVFSMLGKAMLCIAGAYLLRAVAGSPSVPHAPVMVLSIAYAFFWLLPAARSPAASWLPSAAWTATSAVILAPMLWELNLRSGFLSNRLTAAILAAMALAAPALAWKNHFTPVAWIAGSTASVTALLLAIATRNPIPFIAALLAIALGAELAAALQRTVPVRILVATATDLAVFAVIWIESSPAAARSEYHPIPAALLLALAPALLALAAAGATTRTLLLRRAISFFDVAQTLVGFLLSIWSLLVFWTGPAALVLGILCLAASSSGYAIAFLGFDRTPSRRNYHVYATGSLALLVAGCFLCLPSVWLSLCLSIFAIATVILGTQTSHLSLEFHGMAALTAAAVASGLLPWALRNLAGTWPAAPSWPLSVVAAAAILCSATLLRSPAPHAWPQALRFFSALLAAGSIASFFVWMFDALIAFGTAPAAEHIAVLRTVTMCGIALVLAWTGSRGQRRELTWVAWAAVGFVALKLLFEDLRHGHLGYTTASIFCFAFTLLLVPRFARRSTPAPDVGTH